MEKDNIKEIKKYLHLAQKAIRGELPPDPPGKDKCRKCLSISLNSFLCTNANCIKSPLYGYPQWSEEDRQLWNKVNNATTGPVGILGFNLQSCMIARDRRLEKNPKELEINSRDLLSLEYFNSRSKCLVNLILKDVGITSLNQGYPFLKLCWEFRHDTYAMVTPGAVLKAANYYFDYTEPMLEKYSLFIFSLEQIKNYCITKN